MLTLRDVDIEINPHVAGTSAFRYNLNPGYFPIFNDSRYEDGLVVRVCNCSWGHKGHTPAMPDCGKTWPGQGNPSWGATAVATRKPGTGWEYNYISRDDIIVEAAALPCHIAITVTLLSNVRGF